MGINRIGLGIAVFATAVIGYGVYFDYQRHNSAEFRKSLKKSHKKHKKEAQEQAKKETKAKLQRLKAKLIKSLEEDPLPAQAESELYFMNNFTMGEQLAEVPGKEEESAICFYKALAIYPNPKTFLASLKKSLNENVYMYVLALIGMKPPSSLASVLGATSDSTASLD